MDLTQATELFDKLLDLEFELHRLTFDPATPGYPADRIRDEWLSIFVDEDTDVDPPFTGYVGRLEPHAHEADGAERLERLGRRKLFKVEHWSAPDLGGVFRCLVGRQNPSWAEMPEFVLDVAEVDGATRIVAVHNPHPACAATGTVVKTGEPCSGSDRGGRPCLGGIIFLGGLSFDSGELLGSNPIDTPKMGKWSSYMER